MKGYITTRDLLRHPAIIIGSFGFRVYARCWRRIALTLGHATFLECIDSDVSKR
jgi:hypothetical protein